MTRKDSATNSIDRTANHQKAGSPPIDPRLERRLFVTLCVIVLIWLLTPHANLVKTRWIDHGTLHAKCASFPIADSLPR